MSADAARTGVISDTHGHLDASVAALFAVHFIPLPRHPEAARRR